MKNHFNRRNFLKILGSGTCGAVAHSMISPFENVLAISGAHSAKLVGSNPVLIVINLAGGCSYNLTPVYHGAYRDKNPTISYGPENSLAINSEQGLHPALTAFKSIYDEGHLALINKVGYPNPNRSHDESTDIWFRGTRLGNSALGGWGARLTCQMNNAFGGISLGGTNLLISGDCNPPRSFNSLDENALGENNLSGTWGASADFVRMTRDSIIGLSNAPGNDNYKYVKGQMDSLSQTITQVRGATKRNLPNIAPIAFPNSGFGNACRDAAKLLNAPELKTQFIYLQHGGFDTHANERQVLNNNLTNINAGINALIATAKALGRWNDIIITTMTEFSRTRENGSGGTDHGHAAPMLIMGGGIRGGMHTPVPSPEEVNSQVYFNTFHVDFRSIFHELIAGMGYDPGPIFPESFSSKPLGLII